MLELLKRFCKLILWLVSIIPVTFYQGTKSIGQKLEKRIRRDGFARSLVVYILGAPIAGVTGWELANKAAFLAGFGSKAWTVILIVAAVVVWAVVWPGFYYLFLRHVWNALEKVYKYWERFCEHVVSPALEEFVTAIRKAPGADKLWSNVLPKEGGRGPAYRFVKTGFTIFALGAMAYGAYVVYGLTMTAGSAYIASHTLLIVVAMSVAATTFGTVFCFTGSLFDRHVPDTMSGVSTVFAVAVAWPMIQSFGYPAIAAAAVGTWLVSMTYLLPGLITVLQTGRLKKIVEKWYKLIDTCYHEEENKEFQKFWQHGINLILSPVLGYVLFSIASSAGLPVWGALVLALIGAVYSYAESGRKWFGKWQGNMDAGVTFDVLMAYLVYDYVSPQGALASVGVGIVAVLSMFAVVYPIVYLSARAVSASFAGPAGVALEALHLRLSAKLNVFFDKLRELRDEAFGDRSEFARLFGHLINLTLVAVALVSGGSALMAHLTGIVWVNYVLAAFIAMNVLVLFGRLFSRYSAETLATVLGLSVAGPVGYFAYGASGSFLVAAGLVLVLGGIVGGVLAPLVYLVARRAFARITPVLAPKFDKFFDGLWNLYVEIWKAVITVVAPIVAFVNSVWKSIAESFSSVFGH